MARKASTPKSKTLAFKVTKAEIKEIQAQLGLKADGIIGPKTRAAVKAFQKKLGVPADGIIGPITMAAAKAYAKSAADSAKAVEQAIKPVAAAMSSPAQAIRAAPALLTSPVPVALPSPASVATTILPALRTLPAEAKAVAAAQLQQLAASPNASSQDYQTLVSGLSAALGPQIQQLSDALTQRVLQTQATSESNAALQTAQQWTDNAEAQAQILQAIRDLAVKVMAKDKISRAIYKAYGVVLP